MSTPFADRVEAREPCPKCRAKGHDRHGDNLAIYRDGHQHCFACGYHVPADKWRLLQNAVSNIDSKIDNVARGLPADFAPLKDALWAKGALSWLRSYGINDNEIASFKIGWSWGRTLLIFPVYDEDNRCIFWQGRNFGDDKDELKYLTFGEKRGIMHLMGDDTSQICIATEDAVSAIKVGRFFQSLPLWGCEMDLQLIKKVAEKFTVLGIWLDRNKTIEAVKIALRASQYIPTFVVDSGLDPKDYSNDVIIRLITEASGETYYKEDKGKAEDYIPSHVEEVTPSPKKPIPAMLEAVKYTDPHSDIREIMHPTNNPHESTRVNVREDEALYGREKFVSEWEQVDGQHSYTKHSHGS